MNGSVGRWLASGTAMVGVSALVATPAVPQDLRAETGVPVALAAQIQPLSPGATPNPALAAPTLLDPLGQQAAFHVGLLVDWIVTGVQLASRIPPVGQRLVQDIQSGTPVPAAVNRALVGFADVEFDAGRELVGFGEEWATFQIHFLRDIIAGLPAIISASPVGQFATAALAMASALVEHVAETARGIVTAVQDAVHGALGPPATTTVSVTAAGTSEENAPARGPTLRSSVQHSDESTGSRRESDDSRDSDDVLRPNIIRTDTEPARAESGQGESAADESGQGEFVRAASGQGARGESGLGERTRGESGLSEGSNSESDSPKTETETGTETESGETTVGAPHSTEHADESDAHKPDARPGHEASGPEENDKSGSQGAATHGDTSGPSTDS